MATLTTVQGDTFQFQVTVNDANGSAVNLTGSTVYLYVIDRRGTAFHTETVTSHTTPASGITNIIITDDETATFPVGGFDTRVVCALSDGSTWTVREDFLQVNPKQAA